MKNFILTDIKRRSRIAAYQKALTRVRWLSATSIRRTSILRSINSKPDVFDEAFFKELHGRKIDLEKTYYKIMTIGIVLFVFLSSKFVGAFDINILGLQLKSTGALREPILAIASALGVIQTYQKVQIDQIDVTLKIWALKFAGKSDSELYLLRWGNSIGSMALPFPEDPYLFPSRSIRFLFIIYIILQFIFILSIISAITIITVSNIVLIYIGPSYSPAISNSIILFAVGCGLSNIIVFITTSLPMPYVDYSKIKEINESYKNAI